MSVYTDLSRLSNGMVTIDARYLSFLEEQNQLMRLKLIQIVAERLMSGHMDTYTGYQLLEMAYKSEKFEEVKNGEVSS